MPNNGFFNVIYESQARLEARQEQRMNECVIKPKVYPVMHLWWPMNGAEERMPRDETIYYPMTVNCSSELKTCAGGINGSISALYYADRNYNYATKLLAKYNTPPAETVNDEKAI